MGKSRCRTMPDEGGGSRGGRGKNAVVAFVGWLARELWAPGRRAPCTTSGVSRMKGRRQWGASACVAPFALAPVSCKVRKRSWNASHSASSRRPGRVNSPISRLPAPCDVSDSTRAASGLPPRVGEPGEGPCSRRTSRSSPSSGISSPSDDGSVSPIAGRGARVHLATACAPNRDSTGARFIQKCTAQTEIITRRRKPNPTRRKSLLFGIEGLRHWRARRDIASREWRRPESATDD